MLVWLLLCHHDVGCAGAGGCSGTLPHGMGRDPDARLAAALRLQLRRRELGPTLVAAAPAKA